MLFFFGLPILAGSFIATLMEQIIGIGFGFGEDEKSEVGCLS